MYTCIYMHIAQGASRWQTCEGPFAEKGGATPGSEKGSPKVKIPSRQWFSNVEIVS